MRDACAYARRHGGDQQLKRMVVVAHSMGGLLTRSSVTDPKSVLYNAEFCKPLDPRTTPPATCRFIHDELLYQPLKEPSCVVFLAVPHRGSPIADWRISLWLSRLIRLPKTLTVDLLDSTLVALGDAMQGKDGEHRPPTSINSLSPNDPFIVALNKLPLPKTVEFHSIIGDRGHGDSPNSSDGIVPYQSSHIAPVASEKIVPSNHHVPNDPEALAELKRILKDHLQQGRR
jgi:hypothetical protein